MNSIDRLLSINYSRRFEFRKKLKFQVAVISSIILLSLGYNVPYLLKVDISEIYTCGFIATPIIELLTYLANDILTNIIPFFISMISTGMIIEFLIKSKRQSSLIRNYKREVTLLKSVLGMVSLKYHIKSFQFQQCIYF